MSDIKLLVTPIELRNQFERCCKEFENLEMYVAWLGCPKGFYPYSFLSELNKVKAFVGIAFDQTSPEGIRFLMENNIKVAIVNPKSSTYHPKLYFFSSNDTYALLMGSSNFTYSGFEENFEANVLIEGKSNQQTIRAFLKEVRKEVKQHEVFTPTVNWIDKYTEKYLRRQTILKKAKTLDEASLEDRLAGRSAWLSSDTWKGYMQRFNSKIKHPNVEPLEWKLEDLMEYEDYLQHPWSQDIFEDISIRHMIYGDEGYGWLGHVGASGRFKQIIANGSVKQKRTIVKSINIIAALDFPIDYKILQSELNELVGLGPSIKVWGRLLAMVRPDLYYTISSDSVRKALSECLEVPQSKFTTVDGYVSILKLIHQSPWYNSTKPKLKSEFEIWKRRVAFLDVILHEVSVS